jgi:hypothetical protein
MVPVIVRLVPTVAEVGLRLLIVGLGVEADATSPDTPQIETMISRARKILRTIGPPLCTQTLSLRYTSADTVVNLRLSSWQVFLHLMINSRNS